MIFKTERKHWKNGHQKRGGWFHTFNISIFNIGIMLMWGNKHQNHYGTISQKPSIQIYKLI